MNDGQSVGIHRTVGRFGQEIIHQAQVGRSQEERYRVVAIPPLYECVLYPGKNVVTLGGRYRNLDVVADVQHRNRYPRGDVKPNGYIQVVFTSLDNCAKHVDAKNNPYQRDRDVDGPFQFSILFGAGNAQRQRNRSHHDNGLPAPKVNVAQYITEHARFHQTLKGVIDPQVNAIANKSKNSRVSVQRANSSKASVRNAEI